MTNQRLRLFQVDAFADRLFTGNPAAVCPLQTWLPDTLLQSIAAENNLAETAFFVPCDQGFELRWFTPTSEVKLCGHATLASAFVLFECLDFSATSIHFQTRHSGALKVTRENGLLWLDFPAQIAQLLQNPPGQLVTGLGGTPREWFSGPNYMAVFEHESQITALAPDMRALATLPERCVIATAPADDPDIDFVSRFFAPNYGIDEDPVTGSAHCMLAPYWAARLGKTQLHARQISAREGNLICNLSNDRVHIGGRAILYLEGEIRLPKE